MERPLTQFADPTKDPDIAAFEATGGYEGLRRALKMSPHDVQAAVAASNLRGRGGAGFPTGKKWSFVPMGEAATGPKYFVVNADEMEPGTFKDRLLLEGDPHGLIEGAIIGAYAIEASVAYIFVRDEYKLSTRRVSMAIEQARARGYLGQNILGTHYSLAMHVHTSAGRYMCGEETGLLNALEGRRPIPRAKPPFPQVSGLFGKPTIVNNVETLACVRHILARGPEWFKGLAKGADGGTKLYGASGRVKRPSLHELPMGTTVREVLDACGGMQDGYKLRGLLPGGASTDFLTPDHLDVRMDFDSLPKVGSRLGTGTIIVLDDRTCPVGLCANLMKFFAHESCGWCTPCRESLPWAFKLLQALEHGQGRPEDLDVLADLCRMIAPGNTFCALAPGAAEPLASAMKYFRDDFERHVQEKRCPYAS